MIIFLICFGKSLERVFIKDKALEITERQQVTPSEASTGSQLIHCWQTSPGSGPGTAQWTSVERWGCVCPYKGRGGRVSGNRSKIFNITEQWGGRPSDGDRTEAEEPCLTLWDFQACCLEHSLWGINRVPVKSGSNGRTGVGSARWNNSGQILFCFVL